jgi:hypothetical protein
MFGFLDQFTTEHPEETPDTTAVRLYQMYVARTCFDIGTLAAKYHPHFTKTTDPKKLRIGLEFETGNIASSFRALTKLGFLYRLGKIDAGVFITATDKQNVAARIWPSANRNGSFEELSARRYRDTIYFPVWEFGFAPDQYDRSAPYLGPKKTTYFLRATGVTKKVGGHDYEVWNDGKKDLLKRV